MNCIQRTITALPSLKRFRTFCFVCLAFALFVFLFFATITVVPRIRWTVPKGMLLSTIVGAYFLTVGLRTQVMIYQLRHDRPQTFARPAPEWITVGFLLGFLIAAFWPHAA